MVEVIEKVKLYKKKTSQGKIIATALRKGGYLYNLFTDIVTLVLHFYRQLILKITFA